MLMENKLNSLRDKMSSLGTSADEEVGLRGAVYCRTVALFYQ